jgi:hypothetical protein
VTKPQVCDKLSCMPHSQYRAESVVRRNLGARDDADLGTLRFRQLFSGMVDMTRLDVRCTPPLGAVIVRGGTVAADFELSLTVSLTVSPCSRSQVAQDYTVAGIESAHNGCVVTFRRSRPRAFVLHQCTLPAAFKESARHLRVPSGLYIANASPSGVHASRPALRCYRTAVSCFGRRCDFRRSHGKLCSTAGGQDCHQVHVLGGWVRFGLPLHERLLRCFTSMLSGAVSNLQQS